jgi:hypothetical protein
LLIFQAGFSQTRHLQNESRRKSEVAVLEARLADTEVGGDNVNTFLFFSFFLFCFFARNNLGLGARMWVPLRVPVRAYAIARV